MHQYLELLYDISLFSDIPKQKIPEVLTYIRANIVKYEKGQVIFREGEPVEKAGIILSGSAELRKEDYHGNRTLLQTLQEGQMFGEALCCTDADILPVGIYAAEKCAALLFDCKGIIEEDTKKFEYQSLLLKNLLLIIAQKNLVLRAKINLLSKRTTREKIMAYLLAESKKAGKSEFDIVYDRQQLADYLGVERSAMSAEIGKLRRDGVISAHKKHFSIIKYE
ncbi:MAG: Crp/Fnr family transcriptional regulator [Oscillospiraceae bacterium]|nr:Crp/Fnr family transcriptional regulator [Oscillospiraceae bacterium]